MELYESLKVVGAAMIGLFGFVASLDKMVDLWKKYKGLAEAPDKAQNEEIKNLKDDVELLKAVSRAVSVPVVASGGAGSAADFAALFRALPELSAGLAASIFHFGEVTIPALKRVLAEEGVCVRL